MSKKISFDRNDLGLLLMALGDSIDATNGFIQESLKAENLKALQSQVDTRTALQELKERIIKAL